MEERTVRVEVDIVIRGSGYESLSDEELITQVISDLAEETDEELDYWLYFNLVEESNG